MAPNCRGALQALVKAVEDQVDSPPMMTRWMEFLDVAPSMTSIMLDWKQEKSRQLATKASPELIPASSEKLLSSSPNYIISFPPDSTSTC